MKTPGRDRWARSAGITVGAVIASLAIAGTTAPAAFGAKAVVNAIGASGTEGGQLSGAQGVAVNQTTGDIFVADTGNRRVQQFDSSGSFVRTWGRDVIKPGEENDNGTGFEVCDVTAPTPNQPADCQAGSTGTLGGEFNIPQGVAVDPSGNVWVTESTNRRVQKFSPAGSFQLALGRDVVQGSPTNVFEICTVAANCKAGSTATGAIGGQFGAGAGHPAVDSVGNVWVADPTNRRVQKFDGGTGNFLLTFGWNVDASGGGGQLETCTTSADCQAGLAGLSPGQFANNSPTRVAVDSAGFVYAADSGTPNRRVQKFNSTLSGASVFASAQLTGSPPPGSAAVDPSNDDVYVVKPSTDPAELRVLQFDFAGGLVDTHASGSGIGTSSVGGLALRSSSGNLYLTNQTRVLVLNTPQPPAATIQPVTGVGAHAATFSGEVNPNGFTTAYRFEYSADGTNWIKVPANDVDVGGGSSPVVVNQTVSDLVGNTEYRVRLVATKAFGGGTATSTEETFTTDAAAPDVSNATALSVSDTAATLVGKVHPQNDATTYRFEYGPGTSYGSSVPVPDGGLGAGLEQVKVAQAISDLDPGTTYHSRLVATNSSGTTVGPDVAFTTLPAPPPSRGYEMVTPVDKNGGVVVIYSPSLGWATTPLASADGDAAEFVSLTAFDGSEASEAVNPYRATRDPDDGWSTQPILPPKVGPDPGTAFGPFYSTYRAFSGDLETGVLQSSQTTPPLTPLAPQNTIAIYLRSFDTGQYELVTPGLPDDTEGSLADFATVQFAGASPDLGRVVFGSELQLTPDAPALSPLLYAWDREAAALTLVGRLPDGSVSPDPVGLAKPDDGGLPSPPSFRAISADGSRIYFYTPTDGSARRLYMREDASTTTFVSEEENSTSSPSGVARFWQASEDGSRAFFTSAEQLVDADADATVDLYLYTHSASPSTDANLTLVSADNEPDDGTAADVRGVLGASADGRRVYFAANGQIVDGEPVDPGPKLYLWDATSGSPTVTYVATLDAAEPVGGDHENWSARMFDRSSRTTPDGRFLAFESLADLTPFQSGGQDQVYLYDAGLDQLRCASCSPVEDSPTGPARLRLPGESVEIVRRNLSLGGSRLFFETPEPLSPDDTNGKVDVYVFEGGEQRLISSGTGTSDAHFGDASADGDDVFFTTKQQLVAADEDNLVDLYDARVGGGFPDPPSPAPCEGDACQGLPASPPPTEVPGSQAYSGSGNPGARGDCEALERKAERKKARAKRLSERAKAASGAKAERLRAKAREARRAAKQAKKEADQCRQEAE